VSVTTLLSSLCIGVWVAFIVTHLRFNVTRDDDGFGAASLALRVTVGRRLFAPAVSVAWGKRQS
jgi:hypothetical protein